MLNCVTLFSAPPGAPGVLKVLRVTHDSATLQWEPPFSDGGAPINKYVLYKRVQPMESWEEVIIMFYFL